MAAIGASKRIASFLSCSSRSPGSFISSYSAIYFNVNKRFRLQLLDHDQPNIKKYASCHISSLLSLEEKKFSQVGKGRDTVLFNHLIPVVFAIACSMNSHDQKCQLSDIAEFPSKMFVCFFFFIFIQPKKKLKFIFNIAISFDSASLFLKKIKNT